MHGKIDSNLMERAQDAASTIRLRFTIVLLALGILFWRMPETLVRPQFWGEDILFFRDARLDGWTSVFRPLSGYLQAAQYTVANLTSSLDPVVAPALYCYTAVALTLLVVWMVMSPRLDLPLKPLLALAVVVVPMGREELGALCNIQWVLPVAAFAMMFMRAPKSKVILTAELIFAALVATTGPFSIFLAPLFAWRAFTVHRVEQPRLLALAAIMTVAGFTQAILIISNPIAVAAEPYSWTLWITLPLKQIMTTFSVASRYFYGLSGSILGAAFLSGAIILAFKEPYRTQKICMILFSSAVMVGGMYKFKNALGGQTGAQRYFYIASVFSLWFVCCLSNRSPLRHYIAAGVVIAELAAFAVIRDHPRVTANLEWSKWADRISSGKAFEIPTNPVGWYLQIPATLN